MKEFIHTTDRRRAANGFVVVAVLWILAALATLASVYAIYVANSVTAARIHDDRIQAQALISAALDLAAYQLNAASDATRPTRGVFNVRLGGAQAAAEFVSETARIDLNAASKDLLAGLFIALGASPDIAEDFADRVIGWRTPAGDENNKEAEAYRVAGLPYDPRGAPFAHAGELWLVRGLPPQLVERALPYLTVFSGQAGINALDAAPLAVAALPGMNPERLRAFLNQRAVGRREGELALGLLGAAAQSMVAIGAGKAFRVTVQAELENGRQVTGTAVILILVGEDEPFRVLSWADSTDGSTLYELPRTALR
jgi:general secretion pathway protein K